MEAAATGVPVVATDIRGCREAVEHNVNGLLTPLGDIDALAQAILRVITDEKLRSSLGRRGRELALRRFDQRTVFALVQATYETLAARRATAEASV